ncbi:hypothetical protein U0070_002771, partial [Myodes glareolus]
VYLYCSGAELVKPGTSGNLSCKTSGNTLEFPWQSHLYCRTILQNSIQGAQQPDIYGLCHLSLFKTQCYKYM